MRIKRVFQHDEFICSDGLASFSSHFRQSNTGHVYFKVWRIKTSLYMEISHRRFHSYLPIDNNKSPGFPDKLNCTNSSSQQLAAFFSVFEKGQFLGFLHPYITTKVLFELRHKNNRTFQECNEWCARGYLLSDKNSAKSWCWQGCCPFISSNEGVIEGGTTGWTCTRLSEFTSVNTDW